MTRQINKTTHRIKKAIKPKLNKQVTTKKRIFNHLWWIFPVLTIVLMYLLCVLKIFCFVDVFKTKQPQLVGNMTQKFILQGDVLSLTNANSVDLSNFHEYYTAGEGLKLSGYEFSLKETGVEPGTYGSSYEIPVLNVDKYGRIVSIHTALIPQPEQVQYTLNNMEGPDFVIQGTDNQVYVNAANNAVRLSLPQNIDTDANVQFASLMLNDLTVQNSSTFNGTMYLNADLVDASGNLGGTGKLLVSANNKLEWQDIGTVVDDNQTLTWNDSTYDLTIEDGNTVNLGALNLWKQTPIGGYYTTDVLEPRSSNVQRWLLEHTAWGLTELQVRNNDNTNNYSGAVLTLKGSGPDYTNNMFFAKLGDNYYVPSWAGKGVVSTDQPLIIASVKSNDPAHPNNTPYIMFQTGGYYTAPEDKMILDSEGRLGIGDFSPDDKLTVAGNIHLTGNNPGIIHARHINLELTTEPTGYGGGHIIIHPGDIGGNAGLPKNVYIYPGQQHMGFLDRSGNVIMLADQNNDFFGHLFIGSNTDHTGSDVLTEIVLDNTNLYDDMFSLVRYSDVAENGALINFLRYRGDSSARQQVHVGDTVGGLKAHVLYGNSIWNTANILMEAYNPGNNSMGGRIRFQVLDELANLHDAAYIFSNGSVGIGIDQSLGALTIMPWDDTTPYAITLMSYNNDPSFLRFMDANNALSVSIRAPDSMIHEYSLTLPNDHGSMYDVMYNDGSGNLAWDKVEHLLSIGVGDHAVLYSNGTNIVGDSDAFYWDYDNNRLGINLDGEVPDSQLSVRMTTDKGVYLWDDSTGDYPKLMVVGKCDTNPFNCSRIQIDQGSIRGTYYAGYRWSISRDEFGSAKAGLRLNSINGIWADRFELNLRARNYDAVRIIAAGSPYKIITDATFSVGIATDTPNATLQVGEAGDGTYAVANDWQTFSDESLKTDVQSLASVLDKVVQMEPVTYKWKQGADRSLQVGFLAQDVYRIFPEVVKRLTNDIYTINYSKITVYLVQAIKELYLQLTDIKKQIADLQKENQELKQQLADLEQRIERLENSQNQSNAQEEEAEQVGIDDPSASDKNDENQDETQTDSASDSKSDTQSDFQSNTQSNASETENSTEQVNQSSVDNTQDEDVKF